MIIEEILRNSSNQKFIGTNTIYNSIGNRETILFNKQQNATDMRSLVRCLTFENIM